MKQPSELEVMNRFLDLLFLESVPPARALKEVGATLTQLTAWKNGEVYKKAYQDRKTALSETESERAEFAAIKCLRQKCETGEIDGQSVVAAVFKFKETRGEPGDQAPVNPSTGLPFLNQVFGGTLQREANGKTAPAKEKKPVGKGTKTKGGKKSGSGGSGNC